MHTCKDSIDDLKPKTAIDDEICFALTRPQLTIQRKTSFQRTNDGRPGRNDPAPASVRQLDSLDRRLWNVKPFWKRQATIEVFVTNGAQSCCVSQPRNPDAAPPQFKQYRPQKRVTC